MQSGLSGAAPTSPELPESRKQKFLPGLGPDPGPGMYPLRTYCVPRFLHESSHFIIIFCLFGGTHCSVQGFALALFLGIGLRAHS